MESILYMHGVCSCNDDQPIDWFLAIQQHSVQDFPATMKEDTLKGSWTPASGDGQAIV